MFAAMVNYHFRDVPVVQLMFTPMNVIDAMQTPLEKKEKKNQFIWGERKKNDNGGYGQPVQRGMSRKQLHQLRLFVEYHMCFRN